MSEESREPEGGPEFVTESRLERLMKAGHFVVCGEMGPPTSADVSLIEKKAAYFRGTVDAVNLTDCQSATVRMSSVASCKLCLDLGLEPVLQMTCRDRNRLALQSDLLGAYGLGVRNVLCLSGDHPAMGNHPQSKVVYDLDSVQLVRLVREFREKGRLLSGDEMKVSPRMWIAAAANPFGDPFEFRVTRLAKKIAAGADFIQTQAIFDIPRFKRFMEMVCERGLHEKAYILAGIMPVKSEKALLFMKKNVAGMSIPDELIERMKSAEDKEKEGVNMACEFIQEVREIEGVAGIHLMPALWEAITPRVMEQAGLLPRPEV